MTDFDNDLDEAPDAFRHDDYCMAWVKAPRVIGGPSHSHVCREDPGHNGPHICGSCRIPFTPRRAA